MNELLEYILQARQLGQTNDQIMATLLDIGWSSDQIAEGLLAADKQIPPIFSIPVERMEQVEQVEQDDVVAVSQYIPDPLPEPVVTPDRYVNEQAIQEVAIPKKSNNKRSTIIALSVMMFFLGVGLVFWKEFTPMSFTAMNGAQNVESVFAGYEVISKNEPIFLNDSVQFAVTGIQLMNREEFNDLQDGDGSLVSEGNNALLVYYTMQNLNEDAIVIALTNDETIPFSVVDGSKHRVDIDSEVLSESIENLSELKPGQYTSNAIIFEVPGELSSTNDLYFLLQSVNSEPSKGYIKL